MEWIKCSDRLPEFGMIVEIAVDGHEDEVYCDATFIAWVNPDGE